MTVKDHDALLGSNQSRVKNKFPGTNKWAHVQNENYQITRPRNPSLSHRMSTYHSATGVCFVKRLFTVVVTGPYLKKKGGHLAPQWNTAPTRVSSKMHKDRILWAGVNVRLSHGKTDRVRCRQSQSPTAGVPSAVIWVLSARKCLLITLLQWECLGWAVDETTRRCQHLRWGSDRPTEGILERAINIAPKRQTLPTVFSEILGKFCRG